MFKTFNAWTEVGCAGFADLCFHKMLLHSGEGTENVLGKGYCFSLLSADSEHLAREAKWITKLGNMKQLCWLSYASSWWLYSLKPKSPPYIQYNKTKTHSIPNVMKQGTEGSVPWLKQGIDPLNISLFPKGKILLPHIWISNWKSSSSGCSHIPSKDLLQLHTTIALLGAKYPERCGLVSRRGSMV